MREHFSCVALNNSVPVKAASCAENCTSVSFLEKISYRKLNKVSVDETMKKRIANSFVPLTKLELSFYK